MVGSVLSGIFGYQDAPTIGEFIGYLFFLIPALILFLAAPAYKTAPKPKGAES